jgi:hypothetical protein
MPTLMLQKDGVDSKKEYTLVTKILSERCVIHCASAVYHRGLETSPNSGPSLRVENSIKRLDTFQSCTLLREWL